MLSANLARQINSKRQIHNLQNIQEHTPSREIPKHNNCSQIQKKTFTRLRLGVAELQNNKKYTNALAIVTCPFCSETEDEMHFLTKCPTYDDLRKKYIVKHWRNLNIITLEHIMQNEEEEVITDLALYTYYALKKRDESM